MGYIQQNPRILQDQANTSTPGPMTWPKLTVLSLVLPNRTLQTLNRLSVRFPKILSESGKKLPKNQITSVISCQALTGVSPRFKTQFKSELGKGKYSSKAQSALDELHYLTSFNQNVSFAMGKLLQHLSDFIFTQMPNLTLVRRDSYLEHLKQGVTPFLLSEIAL